MPTKKTIIGRFLELKQESSPEEKNLFLELLKVDLRKPRNARKPAEKTAGAH